MTPKTHWHQIGFKLDTHRITLRQISQLADKLHKAKILNKWFFLYHKEVVLMYLGSSQNLAKFSKSLKPFLASSKLQVLPKHKLQTAQIPTAAINKIPELFTAYCDIMSLVTQLALQKFLKGDDYSSYDTTSSLQHSIYNVMYGMPTEDYFLLKRLVRTNIELEEYVDDPEQTAFDISGKIVNTKEITINIPKLLVPVKDKLKN